MANGRYSRGIAGYQGLFLALTLVVMIIIILATRDLTVAILVIGLITNFLIISSNLTLIKQRQENGIDDRAVLPANRLAEKRFGDDLYADSVDLDSSTYGEKETFSTLPGAPPIYAPEGSLLRNTPRPQFLRNMPYPGGIDAEIYAASGAPDTFPEWGHADRYTNGTVGAPEGNPFDLDRVGGTPSAPPCVDDDASDELLDGDERMAYQVRGRNDETRVIAGMTRRKQFLQRFLGEELDEEEDSHWWGRHEV